MKNTCSSKFLEHYHSPYSATVVEQLLREDAIVLGMTNMDEFGMGVSTEHSAEGFTRNPWNPKKVPGGSSGGAAASVAAQLAYVALGSDTGGSVRQPCCLLWSHWIQTHVWKSFTLWFDCFQFFIGSYWYFGIIGSRLSASF